MNATSSSRTFFRAVEHAILLTAAACGSTPAASQVDATAEPSAAALQSSVSVSASPTSAPARGVPTSRLLHGPMSAEQRARVVRIRDREQARLDADPAFTARVSKEVPSNEPHGGAATELGLALVNRGLGRLDDAKLARWMELRARVSLASREVCGGMWLGGASDDALLLALSTLGDEEIAAFFGTNIDAALAELHAQEPPASDPEGLKVGMRAIVALLSAADRDRFLGVVGDPKASEEDRCFANNAVATGVSALNEGTRRRFVRALASSFAR